MNAMKCLDCGKEITEKPCKYCGSENIPYARKVSGDLSASGTVHAEPIIEVLATPKGKEPIKSEFSISTASTEISHVTVPLVTDNPAEVIPYINKFIDLVKEKFDSDEDEIVIEETEVEEEDKGWFSRFDVDVGGFDLDKGVWGLKVKGTPKKIKKVKEKTIRMRLEKKDK